MVVTRIYLILLLNTILITFTYQLILEVPQLESAFKLNGGLDDIIGIYSLCAHHNNLTEFNRDAFAIHTGFVYGIVRNQLEDSFNYLYIDVCNDIQLLINVLLTLSIDPQYTITSYDETKTESSIFSIFAYLPEEMVKISANILLGSQIPLISFDDYSIFPDRSSSHPLYLPYGRINIKDSNYYIRLFEKYKIQFVTLISFDENHETRYLFKELGEKILDKKNICLITQIIDTNEKGYIDTLIKKLENDTMMQVVMVFGPYQEHNKLFSAIYNSTFEEIRDRTYIPRLFVVGGELHKTQTSHIVILLEGLLEHSTLTPLFRRHHPDVTKGIYNRSYIIFNLNTIMVGLNLSLKTIHLHNITSKEVINVFERYVVLSDDRSSTSNIDAFTKVLKSPPIDKCSSYTCGPGKERIVNHITSTWQNEYSYTCVKCRSNYIKPKIGPEMCTKCIGKNASNFEHTECFVPYKGTLFHFEKEGNIITIILNLLGLLISTITFIVFLLYRDTPIVRASNTQLSLLQLAIIITIFCLLPLFYIPERTIGICISKPVCLGLCFVLIIAITMAKVQKPLGAFNSRKRLTRKDIKCTTVQQYIIISLSSAISACVSLVGFRQINPKVIIETDYDTLIQKIYCNTDVHLHLQLVYLFLMMVTSLTQAFRSRKIPKHYSEAMNVVYSTFTCCICLIVLIPLYNSQKDIFDKARVHWILLLIINLVLLLALYAPKVYIILFKSEKNTNSEFRRTALKSLHRKNNVERRNSRHDTRISFRQSTIFTESLTGQATTFSELISE